MVGLKPEVTVKDPARWRCGAMRVMGDVVGTKRKREEERGERGGGRGKRKDLPIEYQSS